MRIRNLSTFIKVARLGSFRAASAQLHVSQPAISARINILEDELGVSLFRRGKNGTQLTEKGKKMLVYAEKLIAISQEMKIDAGFKQQQKGSFKVGIADTLAHLWLSPLLKQWQQQHPQISFELTSDVTPVLIQQLEKHPNNYELVSQPLCCYKQIWVASANMAEIPKSLAISEMAKYPILSFPRDTAPWHYLQQLFKTEETDTVIHTASSVASLIMLVEQGLGIALVPQILVRSQLEQGSLRELCGEIEPLTLDFCCSWRQDEQSLLPAILADSAYEIMQHGD